VVGSDMEEVGVDGLFDFEGLKPVGGLSAAGTCWRGGSSARSWVGCGGESTDLRGGNADDPVAWARR
jgi:hypothetical protein